MRLQWRKCTGDAWCAFATVVLPDANVSGALVIWSAVEERTIFVAAGGIAKNLKWARQFEPIAGREDLLVSWASVPEESQNGVRNHLSAALRPLFDERLSPDEPIAVNLPWEE